MAEFNIDIKLNPGQTLPGARRVGDALERVENRADKVRNSLSRIAGLLATGFGAREVLRLADTFTQVQNRISTVTKGTAELNAVTKELFKISLETKSSFEATAQSYVRASNASAQLGLSQKDTLEFTKNLNKAIILSGSNAAESAAVLFQLSQAIGSGVLQGQELISVLEGAPVVADIIAKQVGVLREDLKSIAPAGGIASAAIIEAFRSLDPEKLRQFADLTTTLTQATTNFRTALIRSIAVLNEQFGVTNRISQAIVFLTENIDELLRSVLALSIAFAVNFAVKGVGAAIVAMKLLNATIRANPIVAIASAILIATSALVAFSDTIIVSEENATTLRDVGVATFQVIGEEIKSLGSSIFESLSKPIEDVIGVFASFGLTFGDLLNIGKTFVNQFLGLWLGLGAAIRSIVSDIKKFTLEAFRVFLLPQLSTDFGRVGGFISSIFTKIKTEVKEVGTAVSTLISTVLDSANFDFKSSPFNLDGSLIEQQFGDIGKNARKAFLEQAGKDFVGELGDLFSTDINAIQQRANAIAAARRAEQDAESTAGEGLSAPRPPGRQGIARDFQGVLDDLAEQQKLLQLVNREREIQEGLLSIADGLNRELTDSERQLAEAQLRVLQGLQDQAMLLEDIRGPQQDLIDRQKILNDLYAGGTISLQEFNREIENLSAQQAQLNIDMGEGSFADGFILATERMIEAGRNFEAVAGDSFGNFFDQVTSGFSQAAADAIVFGDDFEESIGNISRQLLSQLLSSLIQVGLQYAINTAIGQAAGAAATAAGVAQASALSTAYAAPAALASLASFGSNSVPASAGILATVALSQGVLAAADGGYISGPGGPRTDSIPARLSNGEFVVNAESTRKFRPMLENINSGGGSQSGGSVQAGGQQTSVAQGQGQGQDSGNRGISVVNVLDPGLVGDYLNAPEGQEVLVNAIQSNSTSINAILQGN